MSLPGLASQPLTSLGSTLDDSRRGTGRVGSLSEKKIAQQLRGKDGTVEDRQKKEKPAVRLATSRISGDESKVVLWLTNYGTSFCWPFFSGALPGHF